MHFKARDSDMKINHLQITAAEMGNLTKSFFRPNHSNSTKCLRQNTAYLKLVHLGLIVLSMVILKKSFKYEPRREKTGFSHMRK